MLVLWKLLQTTMLRPIAKLTEHALLIGENDNLSIRLNPDGKDEFGVLGRTFDQMVDRLAETRRRLIDQSYHSGIAEMASGVSAQYRQRDNPIKYPFGLAPAAIEDRASWRKSIRRQVNWPIR